MKEIQITLYEIFGYLIPGCFFAGAMAIGYWTIFEHNDLVVSAFEAPLWLLILIAAYLAGHVTQSIANVLLFKKTNADIFLKRGSSNSIEPFLVDEATKMVRELTGSEPDVKIKSGTLLDVCDALLQQLGCGQTREIYIYREGFYRGMFVGLAFLSLALAVRLFYVESVFAFGSSFTHTFYRGEMVTLSCLSAVFS